MFQLIMRQTVPECHSGNREGSSSVTDSLTGGTTDSWSEQSEVLVIKQIYR